MISKLYNEQMGNYLAKLAQKQTNISGTATEKQTNGDRIRAMKDDELVEFLYWDADGSGKSQEQWLRWLKEEMKG